MLKEVKNGGRIAVTKVNNNNFMTLFPQSNYLQDLWNEENIWNWTWRVTGRKIINNYYAIKQYIDSNRFKTRFY